MKTTAEIVVNPINCNARPKIYLVELINQPFMMTLNVYWHQ